MATVAFSESLAAEYQQLFDTCEIRPQVAAEVITFVDRVGHNLARYQSVGAPLNMPWYVIGVIHAMEAS